MSTYLMVTLDMPLYDKPSDPHMDFSNCKVKKGIHLDKLYEKKNDKYKSEGKGMH